MAKEVIDNSDFLTPRLIIHDNEMFEEEAELAFKMAVQWGMVAGIIEGETSTGHNKLRLTTPEELVARAFEVAHLLVQGARDRHLSVEVSVPKKQDLPEAKESKPRKWLS